VPLEQELGTPVVLYTTVYDAMPDRASEKPDHVKVTC
jgi:hypothetical protein